MELKELYRPAGINKDGLKFIAELSNGASIEFKPEELTPVLYAIYEQLLKSLRPTMPATERLALANAFGNCLNKIDGGFRPIDNASLYLK